MRYAVYDDWTGRVRRILEVRIELDAIRNCRPGEACILLPSGDGQSYTIDPGTRQLIPSPRCYPSLNHPSRPVLLGCSKG